MTSDETSDAVVGAQEIAAQTPRLNPSAGYVTIINTYSVAPERADALLDALVQATLETLRFTPGFISASFHVSLDRTRLVNYAQWRDGEAIKAAGADPEISARIREVGQIADSFSPVLYKLRRFVCAALSPPGQPQ